MFEILFFGIIGRRPGASRAATSSGIEKLDVEVGDGYFPVP
jgi:hypothetical protein